MDKYFGTDGFRGEANVDLTMEHVYRVGRSLGWYYGQKTPDERYRAAIRKDTKRSSYMSEYSLAAGLMASDADAYLLYVTTIPSVSYMVRIEGSNCGITISTSHNPSYDNGIKVINERDEGPEEPVILEIEKYLSGEMDEIPLARKENIGRAMDFATGRSRYTGYLISITTRSFKNMKVALDCANGNVSAIAKSVLDALGTETHVMNNESNGLNINVDCGSTHIQYFQKFVINNKRNLGFAHDGDAGRCTAVDTMGNVVGGDVIMYICDKHMKEQGTLFNNTMVTTIMSNPDLYKAFEREGTPYVRTAVDNKYVYEDMAATGNCLGGKQSGHITFSKHTITGDGIPTSLKVMEVVLERKQFLDRLASEAEVYPQVLKNVRIKGEKEAQDDEVVQAKVARVAESLNTNGRILLRQSGTEPVVRVMVEAPALDLCEEYVGQVTDVMKDQGHCV